MIRNGHQENFRKMFRKLRYGLRTITKIFVTKGENWILKRWILWYHKEK